MTLRCGHASCVPCPRASTAIPTDVAVFFASPPSFVLLRCERCLGCRSSSALGCCHGAHPRVFPWSGLHSGDYDSTALVICFVRIAVCVGLRPRYCIGVPHQHLCAFLHLLATGSCKAQACVALVFSACSHLGILSLVLFCGSVCPVRASPALRLILVARSTKQKVGQRCTHLPLYPHRCSRTERTP